MATGRDLGSPPRDASDEAAEPHTAAPSVSQNATVPAALMQHVVRQDYARYDAADQAAWRFALRHLMQHLGSRAHPLYLEGLAKSGLTPEAIPRISEVDARLQAFGWRAVAVTGFLPPRVFQELQALGVLPIAADIRTPDHLAYTPSPDIVHEAIGHAPLLCDPLYSEYVRRIGRAGALAFSSPEDRKVSAAIAHLSAVKELTSSGNAQVAAAATRLEEALSAQRTVSEAARMSRLYWWTAEYGLVGTTRNYKLYGAGLLSSLAESLHCARPEVDKRPLDLSCLDTPYDITREQPQLFVVPSFERLFDVADAAERTLGTNQGPLQSLGAAWSSRLPARVGLSTGAEVHGTLARFGVWQGSAAWLEFGPRAQLQTSSGASEYNAPLLLPLGIPENVPRRAELLQLATTHSPLHLRYPSGVTVQGTLVAVTGPEHEPILRLSAARIGRRGFTSAQHDFVLPLFAQARRAFPADTEPRAHAQPNTAPAPRQLDERDQALRQLYTQADAAWSQRAERDVCGALTAIHERLAVDHPDDWLLRWNLLERLLLLGEAVHSVQLEQELLRLEDRFTLIHPIGTGLRSLGRTGAANDRIQVAS